MKLLQSAEYDQLVAMTSTAGRVVTSWNLMNCTLKRAVEVLCVCVGGGKRGREGLQIHQLVSVNEFTTNRTQPDWIEMLLIESLVD